jgi:hypothetical protein
VHDLGSKGARGSDGAVGGARAPEALEAPEFGGVALDEPPDPLDCAGGGFTEKLLPVTTVTFAPWTVGPCPSTTAPDSDLSTCWAAARWDGVS